MSSLDSHQKLPLVVIVGPTAVGKTELSIQIAERLAGEIVSADSRLFYRGMDIGTAKPSHAERSRVSHHLIDVANPDQTWNLAIFQQAAASAIISIQTRRNLPFLVGGSGQYVHAVIHGWSPPATPPDPQFRAELEAVAADQGNLALHRQLQTLDPVAADKIDPRNLRRTIRALEVFRLTGRKFSDQRRQIEGPYRLLTIGLTRSRPELYARIDARIQSMFAAGFLDEVQRLLDSGYSPDLPTMSAIGYRESVKMLTGQMDLEQAQTEMRRLTRVFVRRQSNWFKLSDPSIHWFDPGADPIDKIVSHISSFLKEGN